ncbi:MAG: winged helix-turn-helix domain-containing protein [Xanthomonadales bacterium]|nr:winged helix-turn-helix domain-containing protein [Xanthomonadales bacterium]
MLPQDHDPASGDPLRPFQVGAWWVDPSLQQLQRGTEVRKLPPLQLKLLRVLALAAGQTLPREQLLDRVWARRLVNDETLSRGIADLRLALDDDARQPQYLVTVPKLGYRLIAPVCWATRPPAATSAEAPNADARLRDTAPGDDAPGVAPASRAAETAPAIEPQPAEPSHTARPWLLLAGVALLALLAGTGILHRPASAHPDRVRQLLNAQPLTSAAGWERTPSFDHAGRLMAYSESATEGQAHLRLRSRDGRIDRDYSAGSESGTTDLCPRFSPEDRDLLWTRHRQGSCELWRAPVLGGPAIPMGDCAAELSCPDWQDDWVVYSAPPIDAQHAAGLIRLNLHDGRREALSMPSRSQGPDLHPRFGADGEIVFARGLEGDRRLWRWRAGRLDPIGPPPGMLYGHAPLPEGGWLVASDVAGFRALVRIDPEQSGHVLLGARGARFPATAADGSLAYEIASYDANLYLHAADRAPRRLTVSQRYDAHPRLDPTGRWLLYQSNRDGAESLYLQDLREGGERRLALDPADRWAQPAWTFDGRGLSLSRYHEDRVDLWWYTLDTDRVRPLRAAPAGCHDAQPAHDGVWIWCRRGTEADAELWRFAMDDALQAAQRLRTHVAHYQLGREDLVYLEASSGQFQHCTAEARACQPLSIAVAAHQVRNFALRERQLYYVPVGDDRVWRRSLIDGSEADTGWPAPGTLSRSLDVAGEHAVIARVDRLEIDLHWAPPP